MRGPDVGSANSNPDGLAHRLATTLARVLLLLYPSSFRRDVGTALVGDVRRRARDLAGSQAHWSVGVWLGRLGVSLLVNALAAWGEELIPGRYGAPGRRRARSGRIVGDDPSPLGRRPGARSTAFSWLDIKLGLRMLVKHPGLTLIGGLGIAVAIAISAGFFAFAQAYFYPSIPLDEADRLVGLENWDLERNNEERRSLYDFALWREELKSVEDMSAFRTVGRNLIGDDGSVERIQVAEITPSGFQLARVPPWLGRTLIEGDADSGAPAVVVVGFDAWRARFASDPDIVGKDVRLGHTVHTVVGVMPDGFAFPMNHSFWTPLKADPSDYERGAGPSIYISGRLAPGFDMADAQAELTVIGSRMAATFPDSHARFRAQLMPYHYPLLDVNQNGADSFLFQFGLMNSLISLLLVVVSVNIGVLIYARTATRRGEIAVRTALGASRGRIVAQLFAESLVLSIGAAIVGLLLTNVGLWQAQQIMELEGMTPFWYDYGLTRTAIVYAIGLTVLAAAITGVIPALQATGRRVQSNLREHTTGTGLRLGRTWTTLIVAQVALAVTAMPIAVVMGWWEVRDATTLPTYPDGHFVAAAIEPALEPPPGADAEAFRESQLASLESMHGELYRALEAEPGVVGVSYVAEGIPPGGPQMRVRSENGWASWAEASGLEVRSSRVAVDFFQTVDVEVLAGRSFESGDEEADAADVVIANGAFVRRSIGDGSAVGRRVRFVSDDSPAPGTQETERWYEIVGVVEDLVENRVDESLVEPRLYRPIRQDWAGQMQFLIRATGVEAGVVAGRFREMTAALDPTVRVSVTTLEEAFRQQRVALTLVALVVGLAELSVLLLSAAGIYALMSFTVSQRRREIGIRTALGAQPRRLVRGIFGQALRQISLGIALGVGTALLLDEMAGGELLRGGGGALLPSMVGVMSVVGLLAVVGPARRGLRIEPTEALKGE